MNYEIVATLGPASSTPAIWQAMLDAGATAFRLNTSHLTLAQLQHWCDQVMPFLATCRPQPPLILDLQGSKWRVGDFAPVMLDPGETIELVLADSTDRPNTLPVPHPDFFQAAPYSSADILLNDAKIKLARESSGSDTLRAKVIVGGELLPRKGITYADSSYRQEQLSAKDRAIIEQTREVSGVRYALSYVKDAEEMARYRSLCGAESYLIAKLERQPAVDEADRIAVVANELWLCRGDLGAELGSVGMAYAAHAFSGRVADLPSPALLAGQVLEHMAEHPVPTRSEVCALYDALRAGYRGCVLSDEAAIGRYPIESCRTAALFRYSTVTDLARLRG